MQRAVGIWLLIVAALIVLMVTVGGLTRLTGSGLSITEWKPVTGVMPPMSERSWASEFGKYQQIPQYARENSDMTLSEFKSIYWWEWTHRFLGRLIGAVFLIPFLYFLWAGAIGRQRMGCMILLFALGGLQGAVGWWMVKSGLDVRVSVSQYRLAIHLGLAVLLLGAVLWTALEYLKPRNAMSGGQAAPLKRIAAIFVGLVYVQILLGALVAGLDAGLVYNTWPLMNGQMFPEGAFFHTPWWSNFFENDALVQFDHRIGAYLVTAAAIFLFVKSRRTRLSGPARASNMAVLHTTLLQVAIGIFTLLYQAPILLAAAHQLAAALLFAVAVWNLFETSRGQPVFARA